ncbi:MAG: hypothetical protein IKE16_03385 [Solobacterium sp.]|nr:hypothetical protein [Solobacterium sp.]
MDKIVDKNKNMCETRDFGENSFTKAETIWVLNIRKPHKYHKIRETLSFPQLWKTLFEQA